MKNPMRRERDKKRTIAEPLSNVVNVYNESDISWGMDQDALHEGYKKGEHNIVDKGVMPDLVKSPLQTSVYNDEQRGYTAQTADSKKVLASSGYKDSPLRAAQESHNLASTKITRVTPNQFDGN